MEKALHDRTACCLLRETIQRALLAEAGLTLQWAIEVVQSIRAAHKNDESLKGTVLSVYRVGQSVHTTYSSGSPTSSSELAGGQVGYR